METVHPAPIATVASSFSLAKSWRTSKFRGKSTFFSTDFVDYIDYIDCIVDFGFDKLTEIQITDPPVLGPTVGAFYPLSLSWKRPGCFPIITDSTPPEPPKVKTQRRPVIYRKPPRGLGCTAKCR
jgi:hypothetical protein